MTLPLIAMPQWHLLAALVLAISSASTASAQQPLSLAALQYQDQRLAIIADRMLLANRNLCPAVNPLTGMVIHGSDQYGAAAQSRFRNGSLAIAYVVPGSPAETTGLLTDDALVSIADHDLSVLRPAPRVPVRDLVYDILAVQPSWLPLHLTIKRSGEIIPVILHTHSGCRVVVEVLADDSIAGQTDGRFVQISYGLAARISDDDLAVVLAHELALAVLEHRRRIETEPAGKGRKFERQMEVEADQMSAYLLANAGYDPAIAPHFWRSAMGRRAGGGTFHSRFYPSPTARAELIEQEIARYLISGSDPPQPSHLLTYRDRGSDKN